MNDSWAPSELIYHIPLLADNAAEEQIIMSYQNEQEIVFEKWKTSNKDSWLVNIGGYFYPAQEHSQQDWGDMGQFTILKSEDDYFAVPIDGGVYYYSYLGEDWTPVERVQAQ